jgi:AraC-like DNA-binding protein
MDFVLPSEAEAMASDDPVMKRLMGELAERWLRLRSREAEKPADPLQKWRLKRVLAYVDEHLGEPVSLADMARSAGLSRMYFAARFRAATGLRPHDYILRRRIDRAKQMLVETNEALVDVALDVGFQTQAHFTTVFKKIVGETPGRWRAFSRMPA